MKRSARSWAAGVPAAIAAAATLGAAAPAAAQPGGTAQAYKTVLQDFQKSLGAARAVKGGPTYRVLGSGPCSLSFLAPGARNPEQLLFSEDYAFSRADEAAQALKLVGPRTLVFDTVDAAYAALAQHNQLRFLCDDGPKDHPVPPAALIAPGYNRTGTTPAVLHYLMKGAAPGLQLEVGTVERKAGEARIQVKHTSGLVVFLLMSGCRADDRCDELTFVAPIGTLAEEKARGLNNLMVQIDAFARLSRIGSDAQGRPAYAVVRSYGMDTGRAERFLSVLAGSHSKSFIKEALQAVAIAQRP